MKKLLALLGGIMMIGTSASSVVACAGRMVNETNSFTSIDARTDYDLWQGIKPKAMDDIMKLDLKKAEEKIQSLQDQYREVDPNNKNQEAINNTLWSGVGNFPELPTKDYVDTVYLAQYFLPLLTAYMSLNRYEPVVFIRPDLTAPLEKWAGRNDVNEENQTWITALYNYWIFRKMQTDDTTLRFRQIFLMDGNEAWNEYKYLSTKNLTNLKGKNRNWELSTLIIDNNSNVIPENLTLTYLNEEYLPGYYLPKLTLIAWNAHHPDAALFDKKPDGTKLQNPETFDKLAHETLDHAKDVLANNILLSQANRKWMYTCLRYLEMGLERFAKNS